MSAPLVKALRSTVMHAKEVCASEAVKVTRAMGRTIQASFHPYEKLPFAMKALMVGMSALSMGSLMASNANKDTKKVISVEESKPLGGYIRGNLIGFEAPSQR
jgi:hypothetical protein